jgi:YbgC/YbaW family acyl-CoA thioester hydrolase
MITQNEIRYQPTLSNLDHSNFPFYYRDIHVHETDKDGVVHFSNYFRIAEEAIFTGLKKLGFCFEENKCSMAMIEATAHYNHPIKFSDRIKVVVPKIIMQRVKFLATVEFLDERNICLASIQVKSVLIEINDRKAIPLPDTLKIAVERCVR